MNFKVFQTIKGLHKKMDPEIMALFIITIGYTCLLGYLATLNSSNLRYIDAFDVDESHAVNLVYEMIKGRSLDPKGFFNYGSLYFYITILFLIPIRLFGHITHTKIVLALRLVETLSAAGSAIVVYLISEKLNVPKWSGVFAAFLLLITQTVLHWSLQAHPDMPQLFFMMLSLYFTLFLLQKKNKKYIILSSLFAGLAFGIKYAGIFIMTGIAAGIFTQEIRLLLNRGNNLKEFFLRLSTKGLLSVCIFLSAFVITNPFILKDFDGFISDVKYESEHVALGHGVYESRDGSKWIEMFGQDNLVGIYVLISYAICIKEELTAE